MSEPILPPTPEPSTLPPTVGESAVRPVLTPAVCWAVAALTVAVQMGVEPWERYPVGCDEAHILQSAVRLSRGLGFTNSWQDGLRDVAEPEYLHAHTWPPFVGWVSAGLLALGLGFEGLHAVLTAAKLLAALLGAYGWLRLGGRLLPPGPSLLWAAAVPGLIFAQDKAFVYGPSHLFAWAFMPGLISGLLDAAAAGSAESTRRALLRAGLFSAAMLAFRYNLYVLPAGAAAAFFLTGSSWTDRLRSAAIYCLPGGLTFAAFVAYSKLGFGLYPWVEGVPSAGRHWENLLQHEPITLWFAFGFGLEEAVYKLKPSARRETWPLAVFVPFYALMAGVAVTAWRRAARPATWGADSPRFLRIGGLFALALVGLLTPMTLRADPAGGWFPLEELRYYTDVLPLAVLAWLAVLGRAFGAESESVWPPRVPRAADALMWLLVAAMVVLECRFVVHGVRRSLQRSREVALSGVRTPPQLERVIRARAAEAIEAGLTVRVIDDWDRGVGPLVEDDGVPARKLEGELLTQARCGRRAVVMVVVRWYWNDKAGLPEKRESTLDALQWADYLGLRPAESAWDRGELCRVYRGVVEPFEPGRRPWPAVREPRPDEWPTPTLAEANSDLP